ncbi:FAD:protein FMN transferase [Mesorhizobium sp. NZP2077]|uniref:FAD:protein FMN transferase n=1 Tax=Mesorhizobium sp. NZP2077 TaxID=2483404 RepID=UPI0032B2AED1
MAAVNRGDVPVADWSGEMMEVQALARQTKDETDGYFDIRKPDGSLDPSGIVKGWAIRNAAGIVQRAGISDFFIEAGGDPKHSWRGGILFIEQTPGLEGYLVDANGRATPTTGFGALCLP